MHKYLVKAVIIAAMGGTLALGGCASVEDVQKAQATANQALDAAHQAQQTADQARH